MPFPSGVPTNLSRSELEEQIRQSVVAMVNEPAQKVIIIFDGSHEDIVLQVKYVGPDRPFGWVIPVPGRPEVKQGSLDCFYDVSRAINWPLWPDEYDESWMLSSMWGASKVKYADIATGGELDSTIIASAQPNGLAHWLDSNRFSLPEAARPSVQSFVDKGWPLVAIRIEPKRAADTNNPLELPPIVISFPTDKCVASLPLSTGAEGPARASIFVISVEPLVSRMVFDQKIAACAQERIGWVKNRPEREKNYYAEFEHQKAIEKQIAPGPNEKRPNFLDPADPVPPSAMDEFAPQSVTVRPFSESDDDFPGEEFLGFVEIVRQETPAKAAFAYGPVPAHLEICTRDFPCLAGKDWAVTWETETFSPEQRCGLEFEPVLSLYASKLKTLEGRPLIRQLARFGSRGVPLLLATFNAGGPHERKLAVSAMSQMSDKRLAPTVRGLLGDADPQTFMDACQFAFKSWDDSFVPLLEQRVTDANPFVRSQAASLLRAHARDSVQNVAAYERIAAQGGPGAIEAAELLQPFGKSAPVSTVLPLLISSNRYDFQRGLSLLRDHHFEINEIELLLTSAAPSVRKHGLLLLTQRWDKPAAEQMVKMLRDPDEGVRWTARQNLRMLSGQKLGADPTAWENWWAAAKDGFVPVPRVRMPPAESAEPAPDLR